MPTELRHLIFSVTEVVEAITSYHRARGMAMPSGTVVGAGLTETPAGAPISFSILILSDRALPGGEKAKPQEVTLGGADLIAALIGHCRSCSIPVPAKGSKALERYGSQLGLVITLGRPPAAASERPRG
ncbi:hypothetical protein EAH89_30405 [Roseomonas nepalensis]|uniref:Uncharacterized protein n=1 Tax=Muricoccus nepalensis TaxID=1854500 RepID=A0A502EGS2_9PROT|nr:hypothetical protein [Roseomonas nepalensis]TPG36239.1 hypothetical protein EAH89_30405 [Roseomonas nepalensis]